MANRAALLSLAGPTLAGYLDDPAVIEILINPNETCFVERFGLGMRESLAPRDRGPRPLSGGDRP